MPLLKGTLAESSKIESKPAIKSPAKPKTVLNPFNLTYGDGWRFGVGLSAALIIAAPIILAFISCVGWMAIVALGLSLGSLGN